MAQTNVHENIEERMFGYHFFIRYYREEFLKLSLQEWTMLTELIKSQEYLMGNHSIQEAVNLLDGLNEEAVYSLERDFNRLFIGPNRLLAPPYESSYRNMEGAVMQQETLNVRNFYHHEGFQVAEEGSLPDDHIHYELEFLLLLLDRAEEQNEESVRKLFLENHLLRWGFTHCERIEQHSENPITKAVGLFLKGFLETERMIEESGDQYVN